MRSYQIPEFGIEHLALESGEGREPGRGEIRIEVGAFSLNFRDVLIVEGLYNPRLSLPAVPVSDAAGVVTAVGDDVTQWRVGDRVMSHFVAGWLDGPFRSEYVRTTLGTPGPGLAAEEVILPQDAVVAVPTGWTAAAASTLPIAALTAWSALVTASNLQAGQTVLALGTGGVSIFALQLAKAMGARVLITSSSDDKLARAHELGADEGINYVSDTDWEKQVMKLTDGQGADVVVECGGAGTLSRSLRATRGGGTVAMMGALTGLRAEVDITPIVMRRLTVAGIMVDSRAAFVDMVQFLEAHRIEPVIDRTFEFEEFPAALAHMKAGAHFGKIVINVGDA